MRTLFILPPSRFTLKEIGIVGMPLGLAYLASVIEEEGHRVRVIDAPTLGYDMRNVEEEVRGFRPELVGITSTTAAIYDAYRVAELTKQIDQKIKVVVGGCHVTFTAEETLKECPFIDIVVKGEGEITARELVRNLEGGLPLEEVKGIAFREDGEIKETENRAFIKNLDEIPFPSYHLLPMDRYKLGKHRFANMITSRGCPFSCIFCSSSELCGRTWRARSPENVIGELRMLKDKYEVREVELLDDTFTLNNRRVEKICDSIIREDLDLSWSASSRVNTLTQNLAHKMRRAGCHTLYLGIESGSQRILNMIQKGISLAQAEKAIRIAKRASLNTLGSFVIGIPGETVGSINKTIQFARKLSPSFAQFTICTPYPGTQLFKIAKEKGLLLTRDWSRYTILDPVMKIPGMVGEKLERWLIKAYANFYLRPRFILRQVKKRNLFMLQKSFKLALDYVGH